MDIINIILAIAIFLIVIVSAVTMWRDEKQRKFEQVFEKHADDSLDIARHRK